MLLRHVNRQPRDVFVGGYALKHEVDRAGGVLSVVNDEQRTMRYTRRL